MQYDFYTTKEIRPTGWLLRQLRIQANGLAGNLDKVWPSVRDCPWVKPDAKDYPAWAWERVPYWLDGFIPLAYLLDDDDLKTRAQRYVEAILSCQREDGWLLMTPPEDLRNKDLGNGWIGWDYWPVLLLGKVLTVYFDCTGDKRIPVVLEKSFRLLNQQLDTHPLFCWGKHRWFEGFIPLLFLYERTQEKWIQDLALKLKRQGADWEGLFRKNWPYQELPPRGEDGRRPWLFESHVVNNAMCLKIGLLENLLLGNKSADDLPELMYQTLMKYHGMPCGQFSGDECLSGLSPVQGTELCGVVESMYSMEWLAAKSGKPVIWADRLERLAFNALPATLSTDMWTHQYDQQTNQVGCLREAKRVFGNNSPESNIFGLEPNFGCCTADFGQGWPKFALASWMHNGDREIVNMLPVPTELHTKNHGVSLTIRTETDYPFKGIVKYIVEPSEPVEFTLKIRIPGWDVSCTLDGAPVTPGTMHSISRKWSGRTELIFRHVFQTKMEARPEEMQCVTYGPLLFSLPIGTRFYRIEYDRDGVQRNFPYCDYELEATEPWNFAFADTQFIVEEYPISEAPFDMNHPALTLKGKFVPILWRLQEGFRGVATPVPAERLPIGDVQEKAMIPYGASKLRMTEMPLVPVK